MPDFGLIAILVFCGLAVIFSVGAISSYFEGKQWNHGRCKECNNSNECGNKKVNLKLSDRTYVCESCGSILDRDFNASKNILAEGLNVLATTVRNEVSSSSKTTVGHTGSNACGDDKVHLSSFEKKEVVVCEAGKILTKVIS